MSNTIHPDLFPDTLLVDCQGDKVFTTSLKVAEHFGKRHDHVLRAIRAIMDASPEELMRPNFGEHEYIDERGNTQPVIELSHNGFAIAVMSFTGQEALAWKWKFLEAFREMETELQRRTERFAKALDQIRPCLRPVVEGTELGQNRSEIAGPLGKSASSVSYHRRQARRFGLLKGGKS